MSEQYGVASLSMWDRGQDVRIAERKITLCQGPSSGGKRTRGLAKDGDRNKNTLVGKALHAFGVGRSGARHPFRFRILLPKEVTGLMIRLSGLRHLLPNLTT